MQAPSSWKHACGQERQDRTVSPGVLRLDRLKGKTCVQVDDLGAATAERMERQDGDILLLQDSVLEIGTAVQNLTQADSRCAV